MVHIAICDDEKYMSDRIGKMVSDFFRKKSMEVSVSQFMAGEELLKYSGEIDILFLDIRMGNGNINGMETARKLRSRNFKGFLLFITILEEMVFQSFEVQAYDYLVKPIGEGRFEKTMERLFLSMRSAGDTGLLVQKGSEGIIVPFDDIVFCEVIDRKVYLHLKPSGVLDFYERIGSLEKSWAAGSSGATGVTWSI